ncbi:hypothetical protein BESB_072070 [Besnoitia besnoiti]|uniref:Uncharacterized protein n=1 Tax=Besnoitia besnoiti TaxID=94643 RepID=A0A2A9M7S7_BESBE|nr:uncharacterized protein BESB_072070 [Besnoitia besnoiti]PFH34055.1 hypothetical protein BESB_072070 [Besnoitia besnoiti]
MKKRRARAKEERNELGTDKEFQPTGNAELALPLQAQAEEEETAARRLDTQRGRISIPKGAEGERRRRECRQQRRGKTTTGITEVWHNGTRALP